jgi:hypothetical protein
LKLLSTAARLDIEDFVGKEVYLEVSHPLQSCCFFPASFLSNQHLKKGIYMESCQTYPLIYGEITSQNFSEFVGMNITCAEIFNCGFQLLPFGVSRKICNKQKS